jgi:hypothetical protein
VKLGCYFLGIENDNIDGSKAGQGKRGNLQEGSWDAIHVIEVTCLIYSN